MEQEKDLPDASSSEAFEAERKKQVKKKGDALIREIAEDNRKIKNPNERRRVVPSDPCRDTD